jgi:cytochrome P450
VYVLNHPGDIEWVFSNRNFIKPMSLRLPLQRRIFGNGLFSSEGKVWLRERRMTQPAFHRDRLDTYVATMNDCSTRMLANWRAGEVRDIFEEMRTLALEVAARCLFNADMSCDGVVVRAVCDTIVKVLAAPGGVGWILDNILPTPNNIRFRKAIGRLDEIIYDLISKRQREDQKGDDLLSILLATDEDGTQMSRRQLRDALATLFFASHQATALVLSWTCYLLSRHPGVQELLLANELTSVLSHKETPQAADLAALSYTRMVIKETLRLYPPNRSVGREALNDCEIGDYHVPAGTQLLMSPWVVHRDARYFESPEAFKPERWTTEFIEQLPRYAYFPFGGGQRVCLGQDFAMMEAMLVIATILRKFRLTLESEESVEPHPVVLLQPNRRIMIRLADRN